MTLLAEAKTLTAVNDETTADEVFTVRFDRRTGLGPVRRVPLCSYEAEWKRQSGLVEEELQPFYDQAKRYRELGMAEQEATYCMG